MFLNGLVALSPSRVADFKSCPQLFKFRAIDRLPEPADPATARGSLVHQVLEALYKLPASERTLEEARRMLGQIWDALESTEPLGLDSDLSGAMLTEAEYMLSNYFLIEDPAAIEPDQLEWWVEQAAGRVLLRGIIDRVEILPDGEWVLTDYKTGPSPANFRALGAFFGLRFYALVCWRAFGKIPKELRLVHLREPEVITLVPTEQMLEGLERQLQAVGSAIARAMARDDWRPRRSYVCSWCPHRSICPAWMESPAFKVLAEETV